MAHRITCETCGIAFQSSFKHTKVCSDKCKKVRERQLAGREAPDKALASGTVGAMSEMVIAIDLMKKGYAVFRALSPACFCDLIVYKDRQTYKLECRTAYRHAKTGALGFPTNINEHADLFALYIPRTNEIIYVKKDRKTQQEIF